MDVHVINIPSCVEWLITGETVGIGTPIVDGQSVIIAPLPRTYGTAV
jgi:hypothetical protein